jgi:VCBS repeat-containing protein
VTLNGDGSFTYTPDETKMRANSTLQDDSFTYTISDGFGGTDTATVTINLTNQAPDAVDDSYSDSHNLVLNVGDAAGVILGAGADTDADNGGGALFQDNLTITGNTDPLYGSVTLNADGSFTYTPDETKMRANPTLQDDSFTYTISDGFGGTDTATVTINLTNQAPDAVDDSYSDSHNLALNVDDAAGVILGAGADSDADNGGGALFQDQLTIVNHTDPTYGSVTLNGDGSFTYTPDETKMRANSTLQDDSFTYTISDGFGGTDTATVTINLTNQLPVAQPDSYSTDQDVPISKVYPLDVITGVDPPVNGDYDPDNNVQGKVFSDILTAILVDGGTTALGGHVTLNGDGSFTYTPPAGKSGTDTFAYYVNDGYGNSEPTTVTIAIEPKIIPPSPSPAAPLYRPEIPQEQGCPVLLAAAASEVGIASDDIQILINNALAINPSIHPCRSCGTLLDSAVVLSDPDGSRMAALAEVINAAVPVDQPFSPEAETLIASALAENLNVPGSPQALASEYVDAFVNYIAAATDLGLPADDVRNMAMTKYGSSLEKPENANIRAYVEARLAGM